MKVFISWSGDVSHKIAIAFRDWLPAVIQSIDPYVSSEDIDKGARWSLDIASELENSAYGVLCVTKDNMGAPWLNFEAGALANSMEKSRVSPFLFDVNTSEIAGPMLQFQTTKNDKGDIKKLVDSINKASNEGSLDQSKLDTTFEKWYGDLESSLSQIDSSGSDSLEDASDTTSSDLSIDMIEEILELSRANQKLLRNPEVNIPKELQRMEYVLVDSIERGQNRFDSNFSRRSFYRNNLKYIEELMHGRTLFEGNDTRYVGFQIGLSVIKDDFPWVYDSGMRIIHEIHKTPSNNDMCKRIEEFQEIIELTFKIKFLKMLSDQKEALRLLRRYAEYLVN